jgi:hypothetical protein
VVRVGGGRGFLVESLIITAAHCLDRKRGIVPQSYMVTFLIG